MPIECSVAVCSTGQERFHFVDTRVMGHVFDIHNTLGRFCDEKIYQEELAQRCRADGFTVHREAQLRVVFRDFVKAYFLDLLVESGVIYELKTVEMLHPSHQKQLINYLLLTELSHGKLVNFHPGSVEFRFVSTRLTRRDRAHFVLADEAWRGDDEMSKRLRESLREILEDWGVFLDGILYRDALLHLLGGPAEGVQPVDIVVGGRSVGTQRMCLLCEGIAWHMSAIQQNPKAYEMHLARLLGHTKLKKLQWINMNQRMITLKTLYPGRKG